MKPGDILEYKTGIIIKVLSLDGKYDDCFTARIIKSKSKNFSRGDISDRFCKSIYLSESKYIGYIPIIAGLFFNNNGNFEIGHDLNIIPIKEIKFKSNFIYYSTN